MDYFEHNGRLYVPVGRGIQPPRWRDIVKLAALRALGVPPAQAVPRIAGGSGGFGGGGGGGGGAPTSASYVVLGLDGTLSAERVLVPRDLLVLTDGGANGNATIDYNPHDRTVLDLREDFCGNNSAANFLGIYQWNGLTIGGGPTVSSPASAWPNLGLCRVATTAVSGQGGGLVISPTGITFLGDLKTNTNWELVWIFRLNSLANVRFRVGVANQANVAQPTDGMWLRFDTSAGFADVNFQVECRNGSVSTVTDTTVVANASFNTIRIRSTTAGTILFTLNAGSDISIATANVPSTAMMPAGICVTDTTAGKDFDFDFFSFKMRGLSR